MAVEINIDSPVIDVVDVYKFKRELGIKFKEEIKVKKSLHSDRKNQVIKKSKRR